MFDTDVFLIQFFFFKDEVNQFANSMSSQMAYMNMAASTGFNSSLQNTICGSVYEANQSVYAMIRNVAQKHKGIQENMPQVRQAQ